MRYPQVFAGLAVAVCLSGCTKDKAGTPMPPTVKKLGIRPYGDETVKIDMSKMPDAEKKVFAYIDEHIDEHVENLQKWIQQPSISNSGEGIPESAEMVKGFFDKLGCQTDARLRRGHRQVGAAGQPGGVRQVRRRRAEDAADLLDVRHHAGDAAGRLGGAAVRRRGWWTGRRRG